MDGGASDMRRVDEQLVEMREAIEHLCGAVAELTASSTVTGRTVSVQQVRARQAVDAAVASLSRLRDLQGRPPST